MKKLAQKLNLEQSELEQADILLSIHPLENEDFFAKVHSKILFRCLSTFI